MDEQQWSYVWFRRRVRNGMSLSLYRLILHLETWNLYVFFRRILWVFGFRGNHSLYRSDSTSCGWFKSIVFSHLQDSWTSIWALTGNHYSCQIIMGISWYILRVSKNLCAEAFNTWIKINFFTHTRNFASTSKIYSLKWNHSSLNSRTKSGPNILIVSLKYLQAVYRTHLHVRGE